MVLRRPEDKHTELGTLTALRVWKDRDTWSMCLGESRSQESKSAATLLLPPCKDCMIISRASSPHPGPQLLWPYRPGFSIHPPNRPSFTKLGKGISSRSENVFQGLQYNVMGES